MARLTCLLLLEGAIILAGTGKAPRVCTRMMPGTICGLLTTALGRVCLGLALLAASVTAYGQCKLPDEFANPEDAAPPPLPDSLDFLSAPGDEVLLPESGYLDRYQQYTSLYFGFVLNLPANVQLARVMLPLTPKGQHSLLALGFQHGSREGTFDIIATEPVNPIPPMTEQEKVDNFARWARSEAQIDRVPPDWVMRSGHMHHIEKHVGDRRGVRYWTRIKNFIIRFQVETNDPEFLREAKQAIENVKYYCPEDDGTLTDEDGNTVIPKGSPYDGGTVPVQHVEDRLSEDPKEFVLATGELSDGHYRNRDLGIDFVVPSGWKAGPAAPVAPALTALTTPSGQRIREFLSACSQILLSLVKENGSNGELPEIVLRALDPVCLSLRGPDSMSDHYAADEMAAYLDMLGAFGRIQSNELVTISNRIFVVLHGTLEQDAGDSGLPSRSSEVIFATRTHKTLLLWSFIAPHGTDLAALPATNIVFENNGQVQLKPIVQH